MANRLQSDLLSKGLMSEYQSAYGKIYFSETALLRV